MTEAAAPALLPELVRYVELWAEGLAHVLGQIGGTALPCAVLNDAQPELASISEGDLWILCTLSGGLRGEMSLRLPPVSALRLAQLFTSTPPGPEVDLTPEHREAAIELLRQVAGLVGTALKPHWGEVQLRSELSGVPSWPASSIVWLRVGEAASPAAFVEMRLSAALVAAMHAEKSAGQAAAVASAPSDPPINVKLDLLMGVELAVTLRFGSRRLLLREILDLCPGAVISLDRQVEEPVDVLLDGRLAARGEVVVMDGNYGLRVTEVAPAAP